MTFINPLDLQQLFVNTFAGNMVIFTLIAFIVIAALSARFQMSNLMTLIMFVIFAAIMESFLNLGALWVLIILLVGMGVYYWLKKTWD
jgi:hypothetical protein